MSNFSGVSRIIGPRSAIVRETFRFLAVNYPDAFAAIQEYWKAVQEGQKDRPENVSLSRIKELLDICLLVCGVLKEEPIPLVVEEPSSAPVSPVPVPATTPVSNLGSLYAEHRKQKEEEKERLFVPHACEEFLRQLLDIDEQELPIPMVRVISQHGRRFLLVGTAKFDRGNTIDQVGVEVDHYELDAHPGRVRDKTGPIVRSNRDRRKNSDAPRTIWIRPIEIHGEVFIRYWFNPGMGPEDTTRPRNIRKYYRLLENDSLVEIEEEVYKQAS